MVDTQPPSAGPLGDSKSWQDVLLEHLPSGIDLVQMERFRTLSPTERLEAMRNVLLAIEAGKVTDDHQLSRTD